VNRGAIDEGETERKCNLRFGHARGLQRSASREQADAAVRCDASRGCGGRTDLVSFVQAKDPKSCSLFR
jgi:hypothetical protein